MAEHKDPVCGMQVEDAGAAGQSDHNGTTYYFCSTSCKDKFDESPEDYTSK
jgi:Cu+-exporting ATPase